MSSDTLTTRSRNFFEYSRLKLVVSIGLGAGSLLFLGMCSSSGGIAQSNNDLASNANDDHIISGLHGISGGYGFACFLLLMACFILLGAAVYISPLISGSINEKKMISGPQEIESNESRATSRDFGGNYNSGNPETKAYVSSNVV